MLSLAHIITVLPKGAGTEWDIAQPITFEAMRRAKAAASAAMQVELCVTGLAHERPDMPEGFTHLPLLRRDVRALHDFRVQRPLPILKDILDALHAHSQADYLAYTNVDIGLQPHFYSEVARLIAQGHDAIVINRRTIPETPNTLQDLPLMYVSVGKPHPGFDCFVFRRDLYQRFVLGDVCLGSGHVDLPLICSMVASAKSFLLLKDAHLTFHLGDRRCWRKWRLRDYQIHNDRQAVAALRTLAMRAPRPMRLWLRLLLGCRLLKNSLCVREFQRMFRQKKVSQGKE